MVLTVPKSFLDSVLMYSVRQFSYFHNTHHKKRSNVTGPNAKANHR
jgi:fatty acid desaturase